LFSAFHASTAALRGAVSSAIAEVDEVKSADTESIAMVISFLFMFISSHLPQVGMAKY
jgi:hypothetical protein